MGDPVTNLVRTQAFFTGLTLAFGLLHLTLYVFLREPRSNLFYAIFLFLFGASIFLDYQELIQPVGPASTLILRLHRTTLLLGIAFAVRFAYAAFLERPPKIFRWLIGALLLTAVLAVIEPRELFWPGQIAAGVALMELLRVVLIAWRERYPGASIVAAGFVVFFLTAAYDILLDFGLISAVGGILNAYPYGTIGLFVSTSTYLARDIARTRSDLLQQQRLTQQQETERRLLEADVSRKTRELEEARRLQLSMIPDAFPDLPHLDVAARMLTATEVGGDYYDYRVEDDGTVTLTIGDATGHGLRAGTMVAIAKSLFRSGDPESGVPAFFHRSTEIIKAMRFKNLFMAMTVLRFDGRRMTLSAAGMPPVFVFRVDEGCVREIRLRGMPLGAFERFPYEETEVDLAPGDTVLAMSDGLIEQASSTGEQFGDDRAREVFSEIASLPPAEIITRLLDAAAQWRGTAPQDDDMTFLVVKVR